jgi:pimeloyl-ACP methyl ester carboxylesterase
MGAPSFLDTTQGRRLAYHRSEGTGPWIVFLGGLKSDMEGTKAVFLEEWARRNGRAFLRFDYSGHGESSGAFTDGCIGDWAADTAAAVAALTQGPIIPVGSSMGGWQALLLARAQPQRLAGLVTIAAAPDFTEDGYAASFTPEQWQKLEQSGQVELPSDYMEPYVITKRMIEDGRNQLVLRSPLSARYGGHGSQRGNGCEVAGACHRSGHAAQAGQGRRSPVFRRPMPWPDPGGIGRGSGGA